MITVAQLQDSSEPSLRKVFSWQTRYGMAPKFGSRPIGWYQTHQCRVSDYLVRIAREAGLSDMARIKVSGYGGLAVIVGIEFGEKRERYLCAVSAAWHAGDKR